MNKNEIWVLNPDYRFKSDLDRVCLYSTKELSYDSSENWTSYIHPFQAIILNAFNGEATLSDIFTELSSHFNISIESVEEIIRPFLGNKQPVYSELKSIRIPYPKNILIPKNIIKGKLPQRDGAQLIIQSNEISLSADRAHRAPQTILWMLTNKCVTNCAYCYADKKTPYIPLSTEKCVNLIDDAHNLGVKYIDVIGGEVFLRKDWDILIEKMVGYGMSPSYLSTKMPISKSILQKLIKTGYGNVIQISLDSMDELVLQETIKTTNNYIRDLISGIRLLDENNFKIQVDTILTKRTATIHNLKSLAAFLSDIKNFVYWEIRVPEYSIYSSARFNEEKCSKNQICEIREFINNDLIDNFPGKILFSEDALNDVLYCGEPSDSCFKGGQCGFLQNQMFILPDGKVSVCEQLYWHPEFIIGDLTQESIEEIWQSSKALSLFNMTREHFRNDSICHKCGFFESCIAQKRRCVVKIIKAYGVKNWDYPDPRCKFAPRIKNEIEYF